MAVLCGAQGTAQRCAAKLAREVGREPPALASGRAHPVSDGFVTPSAAPPRRVCRGVAQGLCLSFVPATSAPELKQTCFAVGP